VTVRIITGDCRAILPTLPANSVHCMVCSPPYFCLRDYGVSGQIGLEASPSEYIAEMVAVFREVRRVLRDDGTVWLNLGDSYAGSWGNQGRKSERGTQRPINGPMMQVVDDGRYPDAGSNTGKCAEGFKPKDLMLMPARVAIALCDDGWWLRSDIIWAKPNPMPESVTDRPTSAHEHVFLLAKSARYFYDGDAVKEPMQAVSLQRLSHPNVFNQTGGEKDYAATGINENRSMRKAINNQAERLIKHEKWKTRFEGWDQYDKSLGRNIRNVWTFATAPYSEAHFATFPPELAERCIKAGCPIAGTVLDPFAGAGTVGLVADRLQRNAVLIELNPTYAEMARVRIVRDAPLFAVME
jgi:DNA modification methylase